MTRAEFIARNRDRVQKDGFCLAITDAFGTLMSDAQLDMLYEHFFAMYLACWVDCSYERFPQAVVRLLSQETDYDFNVNWGIGMSKVMTDILDLGRDDVTNEAINLQAEQH